MDGKLLASAFRVKPWRRKRLPSLWLFSDPTRLPNPSAAILSLPRGRAGVILRDTPPELARAIGRLCRGRRIALAVAGDWRLAIALGAGLHLKSGRALPRVNGRGGTKPRFMTASAHSLVELRRARRSGAQLAFLSPVFPTLSHPGLPALGVARWVALARRANLPVVALGGLNGARLRRLPRQACAGFAAITALGDARRSS